MIKKYKIFRQICVTAVFIINITNYTFADTLLSDSDHISTGFEFRGIPDVKLGDILTYRSLSFGGMVEMRNETRFNQGVLPNHNWRGFVFINYNHSFELYQSHMNLTTGLEHESAHPTMGFNDGNNSAYDKIYDSTYRNINMNSLLLRLTGYSGDGYTLKFAGEAQFYLFSRNTPELPVNILTWSEGISGGCEFNYPVNNSICYFASVFSRYIFQSVKKTEGNIYYDTASGIETRFEKYPVINNTGTISLKTGIILNNIFDDRKVSIFCGILYGNIYGFVDSREKRTLYSIGIDSFH